MEKYENKLVFNENEEIKIMKINHENKCSHCDKIYKININKDGSCPKAGKHTPKY